MGKIEKGIPIPEDKTREAEDLYPEILLLSIGDSFVVPKEKAAMPFHVTIMLFGIKNNQRHEVRKLDNGDFRVWRTQ